MNCFRTTVRRALDRPRRLTIGRRAGPVLALALAATLLLSALGPPAPVAAQSAAAARLQLVVQQIKIHDDRDLIGVGEMKLVVSIRRCPEGIPAPCSYPEPDFMVEAETHFRTSTGDTVTLDRSVPGYGDYMLGDISYALGFAVNAGQQSAVHFQMTELDGLGGWSDFQDMGDVFHTLDTGEHGLGLGTHTRRSLKEEQYQWGDFTVTYEIRRVPLPDLEPVNIKVHDLPGSAKKLVCMAVLNREVDDAGPFEVALRVDGVVPPGGVATAGRLASGDAGELCVEVALPTSGQHRLAAVVDAPHAVPEFNEANNLYEQPYTAPNATSSPAPASSPAQTQADLIVSAIRVNGQVPDGKDDCKDGKNDLAMVVKNGGAAAAGSFQVRLQVDGGEAHEASVPGLEAGEEREVRFDDLRLRKGERKLTATADAKGAVAESNEENNERKVTAGCKDD